MFNVYKMLIILLHYIRTTPIIPDFNWWSMDWIGPNAVKFWHARVASSYYCIFFSENPSVPRRPPIQNVCFLDSWNSPEFWDAAPRVWLEKLLHWRSPNDCIRGWENRLLDNDQIPIITFSLPHHSPLRNLPLKLKQTWN